MLCLGLLVALILFKNNVSLMLQVSLVFGMQMILANSVCADKIMYYSSSYNQQHMSNCESYFNNACTVHVVDVSGTANTLRMYFD